MIYKIPLQGYIFLPAILFFFSNQTNAQELTTSAYGTPVMDKISAYKQAIALDPAKKMVELKSVAPKIVYDLRYATVNNFMHRRMYSKNTRHTFMRSAPARALSAVQQELNSQGMTLKIFDAYRPYAVTVRFWELVKDERYVANPAKGSGHNRGLAVDLTIINLSTGHELDMGTGFDNFTDTAHHAFTQLPQHVLQNRKLLKEIMLKHGFSLFETEWWHYYWPNDRNYEVLDIPFNKLQK